MGFIVFGGDRQQQSAGYRHAARNRRDQAEHKDKAIAHLFGDADAAGQDFRAAENEQKRADQDEYTGDLCVVAPGISGRPAVTVPDGGAITFLT